MTSYCHTVIVRDLEFQMYCTCTRILLLKVELLWRRAVADNNGGIYTLANAGALTYEVSEKATQTLDTHTFNKKGTIMCITSMLYLLDGRSTVTGVLQKI